MGMSDNEINEAVAQKLRWKAKVLHECAAPACNLKMVEPTPDYCGSIAAAWEIVEWFEKSQIRFSLGLLPVMPEKQRWEILWARPQTLSTDFVPTIYADTAPMAICLAFLKLNGTHG
jgi:hypothetical protein